MSSARARIDVDAQQARAVRRKRVRGLAADPLPRADHDEAAAIEAEAIGVIGDR